MLLAKVLTLNTSNKTENFGNDGKIEIPLIQVVKAGILFWK